jgi:ubiquinone/menaquinone biosynthesis C-methylase UbiE
MDLDAATSETIDATYLALAGELRAEGADEAAVTLAYTHTLHRGWRTALRLLPLDARRRVLDVGCGLGLLAVELASNLELDIVALDLEPEFVRHAARVTQQVAPALFRTGSRVAYCVEDASALALSAEAFDVVFVREVLQFIPDPVVPLREVSRVLRPGGLLCVGDTDDQLRITWPPPSEHLERMVAAVTSVQTARGGDRHTGRKLTDYLRQAGFEVLSVVVLPEAQHRVVDSSDTERALIVRQLRVARTRVLEAGTMTAQAFDDDLAAFEAEETHEEFRMNARIIALGRKPLA